MTRIILTATVDDGAEWEKEFRTHADLFRSQTITAMNFTVTDENLAVLCADVEDTEKYFEILESQATADAMANDGVHRDTVKVFVLDKSLDL